LKSVEFQISAVIVLAGADRVAWTHVGTQRTYPRFGHGVGMSVSRGDVFG
jgi:hypothetical protein